MKNEEDTTRTKSYEKRQISCENYKCASILQPPLQCKVYTVLFLGKKYKKTNVKWRLKKKIWKKNKSYEKHTYINFIKTNIFCLLVFFFKKKKNLGNLKPIHLINDTFKG